MKRITRLNLDQLENEMKLIPVDETSASVGGRWILLGPDGKGYFDNPDAYFGQTVISIESSFGRQDMTLTSDDIDIVPVGKDENNPYDGGFAIVGNGADKSLFEFLVYYTDVEWGATVNSSTNDWILHTSNKSDEVVQLNYIPGYDTIYHSHNYSSNPSGADMEWAYRYTYHAIYYNGEYVPY